jgi:DNA-binding MarR family transcriptional regulator
MTSPNLDHDKDIDTYDITIENSEGAVAKREYVRLLNISRSHAMMIPNPPGVEKRVIDQGVSTKWAVVQVMTTKHGLSLKDFQLIFQVLEYSRKLTAIRASLKRLVEFGLAVRQIGYQRKGRISRRILRWVLTDKGRQVALKAQKSNNMNMCLQWKVEDALSKKTSWVFAADLAAELQVDKKRVSGALRKLFAKDRTIRQILAGVHPRIWALKITYDQAHANGTPLTIPPLPPPKPKKQKTARASARAVTQTSARNRSMCLPNKPTLVKAVTDLVNEKVAAQATFSAYDITKVLRERVLELAEKVAANGAIILDSISDIDPKETSTVYVKGKSVPKIEHDDVKEVISHLFNTGALSGYDRNFNGTYMEYVKQAAVADPAPDPTSPPLPTPGSGTYDGSSTI